MRNGAPRSEFQKSTLIETRRLSDASTQTLCYGQRRCPSAYLDDATDKQKSFKYTLYLFSTTKLIPKKVITKILSNMDEFEMDKSDTQQPDNQSDTEQSGMNQTPPAKTRRLNSEAVPVYVGKKKEKYFVHQDILCATSTVVQIALNGSWRESEIGALELPGVEPDAFLRYVTWLYWGTIDVHCYDEVCDREMHSSYDVWDILTKAHQTGDFLGDLAYCNASTDSMYDHLIKRFCRPELHVICMFWDRLRPKSGMQRLLFGIALYHADDKELDKCNAIDRGLLFELLKRLLKSKSESQGQDPALQDASYYHDTLEQPKVE